MSKHTVLTDAELISLMLATLRHCLEHCEKEGGPDLEFIIDDKSGHMLDVEMIRQAIAKAEGRT